MRKRIRLVRSSTLVAGLRSPGQNRILESDINRISRIPVLKSGDLMELMAGSVSVSMHGVRVVSDRNPGVRYQDVRVSTIGDLVLDRESEL